MDWLNTAKHIIEEWLNAALDWVWEQMEQAVKTFMKPINDLRDSFKKAIGYIIGDFSNSGDIDSFSDDVESLMFSSSPHNMIMSATYVGATVSALIGLAGIIIAAGTCGTSTIITRIGEMFSKRFADKGFDTLITVESAVTMGFIVSFLKEHILDENSFALDMQICAGASFMSIGAVAVELIAGGCPIGPANKVFDADMMMLTSSIILALIFTAIKEILENRGFERNIIMLMNTISIFTSLGFGITGLLKTQTWTDCMGAIGYLDEGISWGINGYFLMQYAEQLGEFISWNGGF